MKPKAAGKVLQAAVKLLREAVEASKPAVKLLREAAEIPKAALKVLREAAKGLKRLKFKEKKYAGR